MPSDPPPIRGSRTILVVDDDAAIAALVARIVQSAGFDVRLATSVEVALELAASQGFDLIISDVQMPTLRGPELLVRLQSMGVTCPVLFISGDDSIAAVDDSLRTPRALFLPKPFTPSELSEAIWAALRQR